MSEVKIHNVEDLLKLLKDKNPNENVSCPEGYIRIGGIKYEIEEDVNIEGIKEQMELVLPIPYSHLDFEKIENFDDFCHQNKNMLSSEDLFEEDCDYVSKLQKNF